MIRYLLLHQIDHLFIRSAFFIGDNSISVHFFLFKTFTRLVPHLSFPVTICSKFEHVPPDVNVTSFFMHANVLNILHISKYYSKQSTKKTKFPMKNLPDSKKLPDW